MNLENVKKAIEGMHKGIKRRSNARTKVELEKLEAFSSLLKSQLPEELASVIFTNFDRHLHFIGYYLKLRDYEWMESNFRDIVEFDFPQIQLKVYQFVETGRVPIKKRPNLLSKKVFLVHGRDKESVRELKSILKEVGLNPIVLHEQPSGSRTIVEKLEKYSEVGYAFVILTPDDLGSSSVEFNIALDSCLREFVDVLDKEQTISKGEKRIKEILAGSMEKRARQNVVLEFGYFMGLLSRDRVCCLYKGAIEVPSDMHGIVYIPFKDSISEAKEMIIKELRAAGYKIKI